MVNAHGRVLRGFETSVLTADSLYDRVINIKAIRKSGKSFVIRSDYELIEHGGVSYIGRCLAKPDIKVTYMQVSNTVTFQIKVEIVNFYMPAERGASSLFSDAKDPVTNMHLYMGYINQFYDWSKADQSDENVLKEFKNLSRETNMSGNKLEIRILDSYTRSMPPDQVTVFNGIVGSLDDALRRENVTYDGDGVYGNIDFPEEYTSVEKVFFELITSRFVSSRFTSRTVTSADGVDLEIFDYALYRGDASLEDQEAKTNEERWGKVPLQKGIMSKDDALTFGIICAVSNSLREWSEKYIPKENTYDYMTDCISQMYAIKANIPLIRWFVQNDGSLLIYMRDDAIDTLITGPLGTRVRQMDQIILPAIYDITFQGVRKINAPFFNFLNPMQIVGFSSRYFISNQSGFFTMEDDGLLWFRVLYIKTSFSTVQDDNTMQLTCTDIDVNEESDEDTPKDTEKQDTRNSNWVQQFVTIESWVDFGGNQSVGSWSQVVLRHMFPNKAPEEEDWNPTMIEALQDLISWNEELNSHNTKKYGIKNEGTLAYPGVDPPLSVLVAGDQVLVKIPYRRKESYVGDGIT